MILTLDPVSAGLAPSGRARALGLLAQVGAAPEEPASSALSSITESVSNLIAGSDSQQKTNVSEGEIALRLTESLEKDQERLRDAKARLEDPESEFAQAQKALEEIKAKLEAREEKVRALQTEGTPVPAELQSEITSLTNEKKLTEERFAVAFEEQKTIRQQVKALEEKIQKDSAMLARLSGDMPATNTAAVATNAGPSSPPETSGASAAPSPAETPPQAAPTLPGVPLPAPAPAVTTSVSTQAQAAPVVMSQELIEAKQEVVEKQAVAQQAADEARLLQEKVVTLRKEIQTEQTLLQTAFKKRDNAQEEITRLRAELQQKQQAQAPPTVLEELQHKIQDADRRAAEARDQVSEHAALLKEREAELAAFEALGEAAVDTAETKLKEAADAEKKVKGLENPFNPRNLLQWLINHGPRILFILLLMFLGNLLVRLISSRIVKVLARVSARGSEEERQNRARTLVGVFHSTATLAIVTGGLVMILDELGLPVGPILGGAAIIGVAVAFGAQRLVADYFHGFVMLLENQYQVNDVVRVAGISGLVERITMRVTVLRDLEGILHFIPNSEIKTVSNMTHGWSRALFEIGVAYKEDADRVMQILVELGKELRQHKEFAPMILSDPEMLGLDAMGDSAIVIKFFIKTRPLKQWAVKRELLRRIKRRFDELGIEIPFPHRTVYLRSEAAPAPAAMQTEPPPPRRPRRRRRRRGAASAGAPTAEPRPPV